MGDPLRSLLYPVPFTVNQPCTQSRLQDAADKRLVSLLWSFCLQQHTFCFARSYCLRSSAFNLCGTCLLPVPRRFAPSPAGCVQHIFWAHIPLEDCHCLRLTFADALHIV